MLKYLCAAGLVFMANVVQASELNIQLRDFALPGFDSNFQLREWCNTLNSYDQSCYSIGQDWSANTITSNDNELVVDIKNVMAFGGAPSYDQYVVFRKEKDTGPIEDLMRVQFDALLAEITVSLISGDLAPAYLVELQKLKGQNNGPKQLGKDIPTNVNQEFFFGPSYNPCDNVTKVCVRDNAFGPFLSINDRDNAIFSVIPTLVVPEPSSLLLISLVLSFLVRRKDFR
jgi:hypothetical protein